MLKIKVLTIFSFALLLSSCSKDKFKGEWIYSDKLVLSFLHKNEFKLKGMNNNFDLYGKYFTPPDDDSLILKTQLDFSMRYKYQFVNNSLILWNEKGNNSETKGHIDEILTFIKNGDDKLQVNTHLEKDIFKLPSNFIGDVFVNYNQKGTGNKFFDSRNNRIIEVSNNGLVKTDFEELILPLAFGLYEFESPIRKYSFFIDDATKDTELNVLNPDSLYVCVYGYNQFGRKEINSLFGEEIHGNVLTFRVDTLKNILKTLDNY